MSLGGGELGVCHRKWRKLERQPGAAGWIIGCVHGSTVSLGHLPDDRQSEPRPGSRPGTGRAIETVEHAGKILRGDPRTVVADLQNTPADTHLDWIARRAGGPGRRSGRVPFAGVVEQVGDRPLQARGRDAHQAGLRVEHERRRVPTHPVQARTLDRPGDSEVEAHVLDLDLVDLGLGQVDKITHQHGQLAQLRPRCRHHTSALARGQPLTHRERIEVRLHARQGRAELVRGVGDELALGQARALERGQHRVEALRKSSELILLAGVDAMGEILRACHPFGGAGQPAHGHERRARDEQPQRGGERDTAEAHEREHELAGG